MPSRSFGLYPLGAQRPGITLPAFVACFWKDDDSGFPPFPLDAYESPSTIQQVPSSFSTRQTSRKTATSTAMYASGVGSRPIFAGGPWFLNLNSAGDFTG